MIFRTPNYSSRKNLQICTAGSKKGKKTYCYLDTASDGGTFPGQPASENEKKISQFHFKALAAMD
jgi:hypothetical protein